MKKIFTKLITTISLSLAITSCDMLTDSFNEPIKDFFKEYTETAAIEKIEFANSYPKDKDGILSIPSATDQVITLFLRNPQKYTDLNFDIRFAEEGFTATKGTDYIFEQMLDDPSVVRLTFAKGFLNSNDKSVAYKHNISGAITIHHNGTGRDFTEYNLEARANSTPPGVENATFQTDKDASDPDCQYIVCFFMPVLGASSVHNQDTKTILINGSTRYFNPANSTAFYKDRDPTDGSLTNPDTLFSTTKPTLMPMGEAGSQISFDETKIPDGFGGVTYKPVYYSTGIHPSDQETRVSFTVLDDYGLSSSTSISNKAKKLKPPVFEAGTLFSADEDSGYYNYKLTHSGLATDDSASGPVYINTVLNDGTDKIKDKQYSSSTLALKPGTYDITAFASKDNFVSSDEVSVTGIKVKRPAIYYVRANGDDTEGLGSKQKPYATIQKAISEINTNTDIDGDTQVYIRLMSNIQVSDTIEFSATTLSSGNAKNIIMEPYGISNATISLGGNTTKKLLDAKLTLTDANLTLNNLTLQNECTEDHVANVGMISSTSMKVVMNNVTIQNSSNTNAALLQFNGDTEMHGCTIRNCYSSSRLFTIGHPFTLTNSSITNNKAKDIVDDEGTLTVSNCVITDNTVTGSAASYDSAFRVLNSNTLKIAGKLIVKNNKYTDGKPANLIYRSSVSIGIESDLTGSDIHISYAKNVQPSYGNPAIFTSGYSSFNTSAPGTFFTSDDGYTIGWNDERNEATLHVSAESPSIQIEENIEITSPTTVVALGTASRSVTFTVLNKSTGEDVTSKASLKFTPKYLNKVLPSQYYSVSGSTVTFANTIEPGLYTIAVEATVNGAKYSANHNVEVKEAALKTLSQYTEVPANGSTVYISSQEDITKLKDLFMSNSVSSANVINTLNCIVTNDITLTNFIHIGYGGIKDVFYHFRGTFDGNGHTITVKDSPQFDGLFNTVRKDTTIKNLTMAGTIDGETAQYKAAFIKSLDYSGASVDAYTGNVVIENCVNKMNILNKKPDAFPADRVNAAGFVSRSNVKLTIKNCRNEGTITAETDAAGFINYSSCAYTILISCINTGNISINAGSASNRGYAAGICNEFENNNTTIVSCINRGKITGYKSGGLVSQLNGGAEVTNSINYGEVNGVNYAGGIAGKALVNTIRVSNCINISKVHSTQQNSSAGRTYYDQGYIIGSADATTSSNIQYNFYINSYDTSIEVCGNLFNHGTNFSLNRMFTSDGHTSTVEYRLPKNGTSPAVYETDVVEHLNYFITQRTPTARPDYSPWTYDSNGLPKLCWEK